MKRAYRRTLVAILALAWVLPVMAHGQEDASTPAEAPTVVVEQWLLLGPVPVPLPAWNSEDDDSKTGASELLSYPHMRVRGLSPRAGDPVSLFEQGGVSWTRAAADTSGVPLGAAADAPSFAYLAAWVHVPRWMKVEVTVRTHHPVEVFIGGESVAKQSSANTKEDAKASGTAKLQRGTHLLVVKTVDVPSDSVTGWRVGVTLSPAEGFDTAPDVSLDPTRIMTIEDVLGGPSVSSIDVSPGGELVLLGLSTREAPDGDGDNWHEIRRTGDGGLVRTLRDIDGSQWDWAPDGKRLSYVTRKDEKATLRVYDMESSTYSTLVEDVEHFGGYDWSPDGAYVVYSIRSEAEEGKTGVKRMRGVGDRRAGERDRSSLYLASVPSGITRRLTAGRYSARLLDIHPDGRTLLIDRTYEDLSGRPYEVSELVLLDLDDQSVEVLREGPWLGGGRWSPDGKRLLLTGGPSAFGEVGENVPEGVMPNEYDTQAYLFDPETKEVDAITRTFDPAIQGFWWPKGNDIYFRAEAGEYSRLYRYDTRERTFEEIEVPADVFHRSAAARDRAVAVMSVSSANVPWRVVSVDMKRDRVRTILEPVKKRFENVVLGEVEDFDFTSSAGETIVGRVYYPPGFDPGEIWPAIVYYYGGTSPVTRDFGGRYPKNLWAANGYVVYVLQPSGATGFGQEFSAVHVNDWGKTTADEVIEGTKAFLGAHTFVDPARVGCIGASYGGFMTELLVTKTDIFAAAVSHAGISDISSYWGEGYWGYQYNAVSAAESFPWNRPDIYVDQSPLFHADKVTTPLLLLHGDADTNVPRGESDQMYTALKLLGKEVEYIRVEGQNHWVIDYKKRIVWNDAIISWFDRWLKGQPEWWNDMYPPLGDAAAGEPEEEDTGRR